MVLAVSSTMLIGGRYPGTEISAKYPRFGRSPLSPELKGDADAAFELFERQAGAKEYPLRAVVRANVPGWAFLTDDDRKTLAREVGPRTPVPAAIVPVTILVAPIDRGPRSRLRLEVPVASPVDARAPVALAFTIDLRGALGDAAPGRYAVTLVAGTQLFGPYPFELTAPKAK